MTQLAAPIFLALVTTLLADAALAARDDWGVSMGVDVGVKTTAWVEGQGLSGDGGGLVTGWAEWQPIPILAARTSLRLTGGAGPGDATGSLVWAAGPLASWWFGPLRIHGGLDLETGLVGRSKRGAGATGGLAPHAGLRFDIPLVPIDLGLAADCRVSVSGVAGPAGIATVTPMATAGVYYYF